MDAISRRETSIPPLRIRRRYAVASRLAPLLSLLPLSLRLVLRFCGSDKESPGGHHYGESYAKAVGHLKYRKIRVLEIGVGGYESYAGGESLAAWACYFPFASVYGCDIVDKTTLNRGRITIRVVDQSSPSDLDRLQEDGPFDLVIDDGSHINAHQIFTFQHLFPKLKNKGIYVVEDVQTSYWQELGGKGVADPKFENTCVGYFSRLAHYINHQEFRSSDAVDQDLLALGQTVKRIQFEHNLILIEKI